MISRDPFPTRNFEVAGTVCLKIPVPDIEWVHRILLGALQLAEQQDNYDQRGDMTPYSVEAMFAGALEQAEFVECVVPEIMEFENAFIHPHAWSVHSGNWVRGTSDVAGFGRYIWESDSATDKWLKHRWRGSSGSYKLRTHSWKSPSTDGGSQFYYGQSNLTATFIGTINHQSSPGGYNSVDEFSFTISSDEDSYIWLKTIDANIGSNPNTMTLQDVVIYKV